MHFCLGEGKGGYSVSRLQVMQVSIVVNVCTEQTE